MGDLFEAEGMSFPALPLWQPYASLPMYDAKPWETRRRPYPAKYHGRRIVVCSTKAFAPRSFVTPALHDLCTATMGAEYEADQPRGHALYSIVLTGCERTEDMVHLVPPELLAGGDFSPGRWAWRWEDPEPFNPFPVSCCQGWFRVVVPAGAFRCASNPAENSPSDMAAAGGLPPLSAHDDPLNPIPFDQGNSSSSVQIEPPIGLAHKAEGSS